MIGIDEVGRGAWAGPLLVVAAKTLVDLPVGLADSKTLTKSRRFELSKFIRMTCLLGRGWVSAKEIDKYGLTNAMRTGVSRALAEINAEKDEQIIIDGNVNYCPIEYKNVESVIRADFIHPIVSAASIFAKVSRDEFMINISKLYPQYGFEQHVGYGTAKHRQMLIAYGITPIHRQSYKPVRELL